MSSTTLHRSTAAASSVGLRYASDASPGIRRFGEAGAFRYQHPDGRAVTGAAHLARIRALAVPPAWVDVWISRLPTGHLQATGRDAKNRKQYRYHKAWQDVRDEAKFHGLMAFAELLPALRARVALDLSRRGLGRDKILATVVSLLESSLIRIGSAEYANASSHYGLTTLRDEHVVFVGAQIRFAFLGKSGVARQVTIRDARLARIVKRCQDIPGQELFQYYDDDGVRHTVDSTGVNVYLREVTGRRFSAKDFRTWAATLLAFLALRSTPGPPTREQLLGAIDRVAARLGHSRAVCLTSYIHPAVVVAYHEGALGEVPVPAGPMARAPYGLSDEEAAVVAFLRRRSAENPLELEQAHARAVTEGIERTARSTRRAQRARAESQRTDAATAPRSGPRRTPCPT